MKRIFAVLPVLALTLGLVAMPPAQAPAEAHLVVGKTSVKKPAKLSGGTLQGTAVWKTKDPQAFAPNHITRRRLATATLEVRSTKRNKNGKWTWSTVPKSTKREMWNKQFTGETLRPRAKCTKGRVYRTAAVSEVWAPEVWYAGSMAWHGQPKLFTNKKNSTSTRC